jgi:hypothetical protein
MSTCRVRERAVGGRRIPGRAAGRVGRSDGRRIGRRTLRSGKSWSGIGCGCDIVQLLQAIAKSGFWQGWRIRLRRSVHRLKRVVRRRIRRRGRIPWRLVLILLRQKCSRCADARCNCDRQADGHLPTGHIYSHCCNWSRRTIFHPYHSHKEIQPATRQLLSALAPVGPGWPRLGWVYRATRWSDSSQGRS